MDVIQAIKSRKSVRIFLEKDVDNQILTDILEMARVAPSFLNRQGWRFVVVRNFDTKKKLVDFANCSSVIIESPVVIVGAAKLSHQITNTDHSSNSIDAAIAMDHVSLAAVEYNLGTCWSSIYNEKKVKEILGIPEEISIVALMSLGYPKDTSLTEKKRLPLQELIKYEKW